VDQDDDVYHVSESKHDLTLASHHDGRRGSKQEAFDWEEANRLLNEVAQRQGQEEEEGSSHGHEDDGGSYDEDDDFEPEEVSADSPSQRNEQTILHGEGILDTPPRPVSARRVPKIDSSTPAVAESPQLNQSGSWKMETVRSPDQSTRSKSLSLFLSLSLPPFFFVHRLLQSVPRTPKEIKIINLTSDEPSPSNWIQNSYPIWMI
jgi:hypothetical protein